MQVPPDLVAICRRRWAIPVLSELSADGGARFVTLARRLGVGNESLRRALAQLIEDGFVERNPGHGHPLRPEYRLTAAGRRVAPACARVWRLLRAWDAEEPGLRKWSLPLAVALGDEAHAFSDLRARLPGITDRALALSLRTLEDAGLVARDLVDARPPRADYRLTRRARRLVPALVGF